MEGEGSRIFRSGNRTRGDQDGGRKSKRCIELADSERGQECTKILRISKLLLLIHKGFCSHS